MRFIRLISGVLDRLFVVIGAFIGSQIPAFIQQYTQRLSGHVAELEHLLNEIRQLAAYSDKTLEQYIQKFISSADPDFSRQGAFMHMMLMRWQELSSSLLNLLQSSPWMRPYVFLSQINRDIAKATFDSFQPNVTLTLEGLFYTGLGLVLGYLFYRILSKCVEMASFKVVSFAKRITT